eukprot:TRINITY_DN968_c0_g1_i5.p1 TRINITY_DN968_c0_g1~~TRINITY_DN968_c0_g1_i5.p1  ORF type:complete len:329 (+),score=85.71 TRINITY_DN968_c0_g1_i5:439-1425(+)
MLLVHRPNSPLLGTASSHALDSGITPPARDIRTRKFRRRRVDQEEMRQIETQVLRAVGREDNAGAEITYEVVDEDEVAGYLENENNGGLLTPASTLATGTPLTPAGPFTPQSPPQPVTPQSQTPASVQQQHRHHHHRRGTATPAPSGTPAPCTPAPSSTPALPQGLADVATPGSGGHKRRKEEMSNEDRKRRHAERKERRRLALQQAQQQLSPPANEQPLLPPRVPVHPVAAAAATENPLGRVQTPTPEDLRYVELQVAHRAKHAEIQLLNVGLERFQQQMQSAMHSMVKERLQTQVDTLMSQLRQKNGELNDIQMLMARLRPTSVPH